MLEIVKCVQLNNESMKYETIDVAGDTKLTIEYDQRDSVVYYAVFNLNEDTANLLKTFSSEFVRRQLAGMVALDEVKWELKTKREI